MAERKTTADWLWAAVREVDLHPRAASTWGNLRISRVSLIKGAGEYPVFNSWCTARKEGDLIRI